VKVNLPQVKAPTMEQQKLLKVSITKNLEIFIADMQVDMESFESIFKSLWNGEMAVVINSDEAVSYGFVMKVVTQVQKLGVTKLGFLTMTPKDELVNEKK